MYNTIEMNILVKKIDTYKSSKFKGKLMDEYIVYLMFDHTIIEAHTTFGRDGVMSLLQEINNKNIILNLIEE